MVTLVCYAMDEVFFTGHILSPVPLSFFLIFSLEVMAIGDLLRAVESGMLEYVQVTERLEAERKKQSAIIQQSKHRENLEADVSK